MSKSDHSPEETATDPSVEESTVSPATEPQAAEASGEPADAAAQTSTDQPEGDVVLEEGFGRVYSTGAVTVREGEQWRVVGEYPDGTPAEALAYFVRKFTDVAFKVTTLEQRHARGGASASDLRSQAKKLRGEVDEAAAVGDFASLRSRLDALGDKLSQASEQEQAAAKAAVAEAVTHRTSIVDRVEELAARDPQNVKWKQMSADLSALFDEWQNHQKTGPRLPKSTAESLWKRFRDARAAIEKNRRAFFADLDESHKEAKTVKNRLIERAEALAPKGVDGIGDYRSLLDEWKRAPRAGRKLDDALWARFKAAGDVLYQARSEQEAADVAESQPRIEAKEALLVEAAGVAKITDLTEARRVLTALQRRWDEVGRISPRDKERGLDDRLRRIEQELKGREDDDWKRNNPERKARANDFSGQLQDSIDRLQAEVDELTAAGDASGAAQKQEELDARVAWLRAIGN